MIHKVREGRGWRKRARVNQHPYVGTFIFEAS
jgi:hypothetical protein